MAAHFFMSDYQLLLLLQSLEKLLVLVSTQAMHSQAAFFLLLERAF